MPLDELIARRMHLLDGFTRADLKSESTARAFAAAFRSFGEPAEGYRPPPAVKRNVTIPGPHGRIPARVYRPSSPAASSGAGLVWMHGGGFVAGDLDMADTDAIARELCDRDGATVVTVDYRLVRQDVCFPVPHDDVVAAWNWTVGASSELGVKRERLAIGGCSAGGNLAAGAALALRDTGAPSPSLLLLAYPIVHDQLSPVSDMPEGMEAVAEVLRFPSEAVTALNQTYRGGAAPTAYAVPAMADLAGLPPAAILTAEYDDLRVSGERFADALESAGVRATVRRELGVVHGYLGIPGLPAWERSVQFLSESLDRGALGR
jgi:acetyl esterase